MGSVEMHQFPTAAALADTAADNCLSLILRHASDNQPFLLALSGGRIARNFCSAMAAQVTSRGVSLSNVHFFWSDERCVPPDDPESNFHLANEALLRPLGIALDQIHRIEGEKPGAQAFAVAEAQLRKLAKVTAEGQPVLQLVLLGMGEDGHVASLFPGESEQTRASAAVFRSVTASKPPPERLTMGFPVILKARNVWVLASGAGKADALRDSLRPEAQTPLGRVIQGRESTRIYSDIAGIATH
jgi:6-phosphogluconolactonase